MVGKKRPGCDVDVAACSLHGLRKDLTVLERHNGRIDRNIAAGCGRSALNRRIDLAVHEPDSIGGLHGNIPTTGLAGFRGHRRILTEELSAGIDGNVAGIGRAGAAG